MNVVAFIVALSISSLKVALALALRGTPVASLAGVLEMTVGGVRGVLPASDRSDVADCPQAIAHDSSSSAAPAVHLFDFTCIRIVGFWTVTIDIPFLASRWGDRVGVALGWSGPGWRTPEFFMRIEQLSGQCKETSKLKPLRRRGVWDGAQINQNEVLSHSM